MATSKPTPTPAPRAVPTPTIVKPKRTPTPWRRTVPKKYAKQVREFSGRVQYRDRMAVK